MATLRKRGFRLPAPEPEKALKVPRAAAVTIVTSDPTPVPLPPSLVSMLGRPNLVIGCDVETHNWQHLERHVPYVGQFGWEFSKAETVLDFARIVQIGWAIGPVDMSTPVIVKTALIQPSDFTIAEKATKYHGISHNYAIQEGRPLQEVLKEFMVDVLEAQARGGRLCAHQLETVDGRN